MQHTLWESQPSMTKVHCRELGSQRFCIILLCCLQSHYPREKRKSWDDSMQRINLCASTFICVTAGPNGSCLFSKVCPSNCLLKQPSPFPPFIAVPFSPSAVADRGGLCTALHRHGACYITLATSFSTVLYRSFRGFRAAAHIC